MHIFQLKSNDMLYKIEPTWILLLEHIMVQSRLRAALKTLKMQLEKEDWR